MTVQGVEWCYEGVYVTVYDSESWGKALQMYLEGYESKIMKSVPKVYEVVWRCMEVFEDA